MWDDDDSHVEVQTLVETLGMSALRGKADFRYPRADVC